MTAKRLTYLLLVLVVNCSCNQYWIRTEKSEQIVWEKIYFKKDDSGFNKLSNNCSLVSRTISKKGKLNSYYFYEFDSIRIYVEQADELLNKIIKMGLIQGQFFISPHTINNCQPTQWTNPLKSDHSGWYGYNFYLTGLREIKTTKFPKKIKRKIDLYKIYNVSFSFIGQTYVNPEIFRLELTNKEFKSNNDTVSIDTFLKTAVTTKFYQTGFEL